MLDRLQAAGVACIGREGMEGLSQPAAVASSAAGDAAGARSQAQPSAAAVKSLEGVTFVITGAAPCLPAGPVLPAAQRFLSADLDTAASAGS